MEELETVGRNLILCVKRSGFFRRHTRNTNPNGYWDHLLIQRFSSSDYTNGTNGVFLCSSGRSTFQVGQGLKSNGVRPEDEISEKEKMEFLRLFKNPFKEDEIP